MCSLQRMYKWGKGYIHFFGVLVGNKHGFYKLRDFTEFFLQNFTGSYCVILWYILFLNFPDLEKVS